MNELKHIPVPWQVLNNQYGVYVKEEKGEVIAQMVGDFNRDDKINHANLIAATPDLLEALIDMMNVTVMSKNGELEKARKVIAKATGETK